MYLHGQMPYVLSCGLLLCTLLRVDASHLAVDPRAILRQHYGVMFVPEQPFWPIVGHWLHTFGLRLPDRPVYIDASSLNCSSVGLHNYSVTDCRHVKPFVDALSDIQNNISHMLLDVLLHIEQLVPHVRPPTQRQRHTRSWLPFLGNVLKTVTGTATTDDIKTVMKAVAEVRRTTATAYDQWAQTEHDIASIMQVANRRMSAIQGLVQSQRQAMITQYAAFTNSINDVYRMTDLIPPVLRRVSDFMGVLVHMSELRSAIVDAMHGQLTSSLVTHPQMAAVYRRVRSQLYKLHPSLHLEFTSVTDVFQSSDFIVNRVSRDIYITVKFPVTPHTMPFTLYRIRLFPVIMPDSTAHTTIVDTAVTAIAYERRSPHYILFHSSPQITGHMLQMQSTTDTFRPVTAQSCIFGLFRDFIHMIHTHCNFKLLPDSLQMFSGAQMLDASLVLFTNVTNITRACNNLPTMQVPGCAQCIYRLPCGCTFSTATDYVPPTLTKCGPARVNRTSPVTHVLNLAVLSRFFDEPDLGRLDANTLLRTPIKADLSSFLLYDHNYSDTLAAIDNTHFELSKAVNLSMRRQTVFRSMAEYLSHNQLTAPADYSVIDIPLHYPSFFIIASCVLSAIALFLAVLLAVKVRALSLLLFATRPVTAFPTHFNFFPSTTPAVLPTPTSSTMFGLTATDFVIIFGGGCVLFLLTTIIYCIHSYCCLAVVDPSLVTRSFFSCMSKDRVSSFHSCL